MTIRNDISDPSYEAGYLKRNPSHSDLVAIANSLVARVGSYRDFEARMGGMVRKAFDEVIDMPRTSRWKMTQLEKTEKTYVGTKVEILLKHELGLRRGKKLDLEVDGHEVDVKNTVGSNWTIPVEAVDEICLIISGNDDENLFSLGLFRALTTYLNPGANRDQKRTISAAAGRSSIFWLIQNGAMPENFIASLQQVIRDEILIKRSGNGKIRELFRLVLRRPVHRSVIEGLARQKDALKRVRANGGARDQLLRDGILILSGKYDHGLVSALGLNPISAEHFISVTRDDVTAKLGATRATQIFGQT